MAAKRWDVSPTVALSSFPSACPARQSRFNSPRKNKRYLVANNKSRIMMLQLLMMDRFLDSPSERATWYSGFGVPLFVAGMMVSAFALRSLEAGHA